MDICILDKEISIENSDISSYQNTDSFNFSTEIWILHQNTDISI